jgi:ABC-type glycerol-3-phosphate transport system permease component
MATRSAILPPAHRRRLTQDLGKHAFLLGAAVLTYIPFWVMLITSFKSLTQYYHDTWLPEVPLHLDNYVSAWSAVQPYLVNSLVVTISSVVGVLTVSTLSAFAFARYQFPGRTFLFYMIISLMMIPGILTLVPAFVWMKQLGLINTLWALILPYISGGQVLAIFILRGFIASLPEELFEAARIDGAQMLQIFWYVAVPLCRPILSVIAIMNILSTWNEYVWPLVVIGDDSRRTITVGLQYFQTLYQTDYGPQMAGYVIASVPLLLLFFFTMQQFIRGLTSGALKM